MGGFIAQALAGIKVQIMGFTLINYHFLFILASTIRFLSLVFLVRVREKEAYPTIRALQLMGDYTTRRLALYKDLILNTMRFQR